MNARRSVLLIVLLVITPALAGCNARDWWDYKGTFHIDVGSPNSETSAISDFQSLKVAVYDVSLKQQGELNPIMFRYTDEPLIIDMVALSKGGASEPIAKMTRTIRPVESVTIHIAVIEAVNAAGASLPACHPGEPVESRPCVSTPKNGAYRIEGLPFSPPRGGEATFIFPLGVHFTTSANEYYIQSDAALASVSTAK